MFPTNLKMSCLTRKGIIDEDTKMSPTGLRLSSIVDNSYHAKHKCVGCIDSMRHGNELVFRDIVFLDNLCCNIIGLE